MRLQSQDRTEIIRVTLKIYAKYAEEFEAWVAETGGQRQEKSTPHYSHPAAKCASLGSAWLR